MYKSFLIILLTFLVITSCEQSFKFTESLDNNLNYLTIFPEAPKVTVNKDIKLSVTGGKPPYILNVTGGGSVNSSTGIYTAGPTSGDVSLVVRDSTGLTLNRTIAVEAEAGPRPLTLSPVSVDVYISTSSTFTASGGVPPYTYSLTTGTVLGSINTTTGLYTAPVTIGKDTVTVQDSTGSTVSSAVNIINPRAISTYTLKDFVVNSGVNVVAKAPVTGSFKVNSPVNGTNGMFWNILCTSGGFPDTVIDSGTISAGVITQGVDYTVSFSGNWPERVGSYILVLNAYFVGASTTITPISSTTYHAAQGVDYRIKQIVCDFTYAASGSPATISIQIENIGDNGTAGITWQAYLSADDNIGSDDILISSGSTSSVSNLTPETVLVNCIWPSAGDYILYARISSSDDNNSNNNQHVLIKDIEVY